jgi:Pilin (bacterial filament)
MNKTLVILVFIGLFLIWKFVLFPEKLDFTDRVKVTQGLVMAAAYKAAIAEYWQEKDMLPTAEQWSAEESRVKVDLGKSIVASIEIAEVMPGSITIYYSNARDQSIDPAIAGKHLSLTPQAGEGKLQWSCKGTVPAAYLPAPCR